MKKVIDFLKSWWKVIAAGIGILLLLFAFGCALYTANIAPWAAIPAIFGVFIAIICCVIIIIETCNDNRRS